MTKVEIELPDETRSFLEQRAAAEGSASISQLISERLTKWRLRDDARRKLEAAITEGMQTPIVEMTEEKWDRLEREFKDLHPELENE